ncbi:MAG: flagellar basal body P-ring formation chaperone FlgA [Bdellovibrionota bacterium]
MKFCSLVFVILIFNLGLAKAQVPHTDTGSRVEIILDANIEVAKKSEVTMLDLVRIEKPIENIIKKIAELKIDPELITKKISSGQDQISLSRQEILKIIKKSNLNDLGARWQIPEIIQIQFSEQVVKSELERKILNQLQTQCNDCDFEIYIDKLPNIKAKNWNVSVEELPIKTAFLIPVEAEGKKLWVSVRVKTYKTVPVTTRWIPALQKIQPKDLELKRTEISNSKDGFLPMDQMLGATIMRSLPVGSVVGASDLKREVTIKRGQILKAHVENPDFEMSVSAVAEESGYIGDIIKIKSSDSQKLMMGKIKDNNSVVIQ